VFVKITLLSRSIVNCTDIFSRFPLFHQPTLLQNVHEQNYLRDRGCFASIMGACALASARQRDGALHTTERESLPMAPITSETFYAAVVDSLPKDFTMARGFESLRACALLCITSIQYGDIPAMQLYLGHYFTLVGINRFQDETCWPKNISNIEIEERRRLVISSLPRTETSTNTAYSSGQSTRSISMLPSFGTGMFIPAA
jgi:hypothetical protein